MEKGREVQMKIITTKIVNLTWNEEEIGNWFNDNFSFYFQGYCTRKEILKYTFNQSLNISQSYVKNEKLLKVNFNLKVKLSA